MASTEAAKPRIDKIGIAVNNLGPSQLSYYIAMVGNLLVGSRVDVDVIAFYEDLQPTCLDMNFANMQLAEGWGFDGVMIATSFSTARKTLTFPSAQAKLFYVWDLEWLRPEWRLDYRSLQAVYGNPELELIARSPDHQRVLENAWNREVAIVTDDFCLTRLLEHIEKK